MSARRFASIARELREAAADAVWIQWQAMGAQSAAPRAPQGIVDPEALVLFSLWLQDDEPRLWDFLYGFAELGSRLLSVQRVTQLLKAFPDDGKQRLQTFAAAVAHFARDPRWRRLAGTGSVRPGRPRKSVRPAVRLAEPAALMLRLRAAFGPGVRTDALVYLIGRHEAWSDVREVADALGYAKYSVRGALVSLADARLIEVGDERPVRYYASARRWGDFLGLSPVPPWLPWPRIYGLALRLLAWFATDGNRAVSDSLASSLARELMDAHGSVLRDLRMSVPGRQGHLGETYLPAFERTVSSFAAWLRSSV